MLLWAYRKYVCIGLPVTWAGLPDMWAGHLKGFVWNKFICIFSTKVIGWDELFPWFGSNTTKTKKT
jgi:hypothetical protein